MRRRRRRSSKKSKKTFTKQLTKRSKSKKIRGGVTTRNGVRRGNYRFLSTLKAQDLTRLNPDIIGEIREIHPLLTTKLNNITLRHAVKDYVVSNSRAKMYLVRKQRRRREYFLGISLVSHDKKNKMEKVRIGMTDSTFFYLSREVELRIRSE